MASPSCVARFFAKKIGKFNAYKLLTLWLKSYSPISKNIIRLCRLQGAATWPPLDRGKRKFAIFEVFRAYLGDFSIFFHETYMIARSYQVLAADIKSLLISALVSLEASLKWLKLSPDDHNMGGNKVKEYFGKFCILAILCSF